jgi:hypothetical protein
MTIRPFALLLSAALPLVAAPEELRLPTCNDALFNGQPEKFYMYVNRNFEGQATQAWEGGCYGYVRSPVRLPSGEVVLTKFHEGIDIAPTQRDKAGNPLDTITSIADGTVAYVSQVAGQSNYGKYVVVEHRWDDCPVYSIYAHLSEITCKPGDVVTAGAKLGQMGFTGAGIDRPRSHVHLEIVMKFSDRYEDWNKFVGGGKNHHGNFNGMNFTGADAAKFFLERKANPALTFRNFVAAQPVQFKVTVPSRGLPDMAKRYPWMVHGDPAKAASWEISFSATGQPVAFTASERKVAAPLVTYVRPATIPQNYLTRGLLTGQGETASLSNSGKQLVALVSDDFPVAPPEAATVASSGSPAKPAAAKPKAKTKAKPAAANPATKPARS